MARNYRLLGVVCAVIVVGLISTLATLRGGVDSEQELHEGADEPRSLATDFAMLRERIAADIGIAVAPVGRPEPAGLYGDLNSGPAWSTMKVPLVLAALRAGHSNMVDEKMVAAITHSDNIAAEEIWTRLGNAATAATDVESELRAAGDPTVVPAERQRPQYSAFGQAEWALDNQVKFMSYIACDPFADPVSALMGQIADDQRWGLGAIPAARFKGGWGPAPDGAYLVRQMGLIPTPSGLSAVAVAVQPDSGQFDDGVAYLTEIARWLSEHSALLPAGRCP